jgi:hypothetical protein
MPYSLPSGFFLISVVPPIVPQCTDAGFAMLTALGEAVVTMVGVGVCVWSGAGCCVHPALRIPATRQRPSMITILFREFMGTSGYGRNAMNKKRRVGEGIFKKDGKFRLPVSSVR